MAWLLWLPWSLASMALGSLGILEFDARPLQARRLTKVRGSGRGGTRGWDVVAWDSAGQTVIKRWEKRAVVGGREWW